MQTVDEKFQAERMSGLGGTDMAAILGVNPYKSALEVWNEKKGLVEPAPMNDSMEWGIIDEPAIAAKYAEVLTDRTGGAKTLRRENLFFRDKEHEFLIAHPDGLVLNGAPEGIFEAKSVFSPRVWMLFGEPWTDEVPDYYLCQVQHYLSVTGLNYAHLAVRHGNQFVIYEIKRNDELIDEWLRPAGIKFWTENILKNVPPPADGSESSARMLKIMHPADSGETKEADEEIILAAERMKYVRQILKESGKEHDALKNQIIDFMKDAAILTGPAFRITYKKDNDREAIDWKQVAVDCSKHIHLEDYKKILAANTEIKVGSRRFIPKFAKE